MNALTVTHPTHDTASQPPGYLQAAPLSAVELKTRLAVIQSVMRDVMQDGADYGVIPGTDKPTLYKPGAEKLCVAFRLAAGDPIIDPVTEELGDIRYRLRVPIIAPDGTVLAVGVGECSTGEEKYHWRRPVHQSEFDNALDTERRVKWTRKGEAWCQVRVHPADVANTVLKMAHKRAYVHGVIMATAAGAIFTQDIEDLPEGYETNEVSSEAAKPKPPARQSAPTPAVSTRRVIVIVKGVTKKEGSGERGPWVRYHIAADDGQRYGTFDVELGKLASTCVGREVAIDYTEGKYGRDVVSLEQVTDREPGSDDQ